MAKRTPLNLFVKRPVSEGLSASLQAPAHQEVHDYLEEKTRDFASSLDNTPQAQDFLELRQTLARDISAELLGADVTTKLPLLAWRKTIPVPSAPRTTPRATEQIAVVAIHGMGQQVPFETIDGVVQSLNVFSNKLGDNIDVCIASVEGKKLARAQMDLKGSNSSIPIHVYEAYWAPLTEGQIGLSQVAGFLCDAGWLTVTGAMWGTFFRFMFGKEREFRVTFSAFFAYLSTCAIFASLVLINLWITLTVTTKLLPDKFSLSVIGDRLLTDMTINLVWLSLFFGPLVLLFFLANLFTVKNWRNWFRSAVVFLLKPAWIICAVALVTIATKMSSQFIFDWLTKSGPVTWPHAGIFPFIAGWWQGHPWILAFVVWLPTGIVTHYVKEFFIQYMGDVAIYLSAYKLSKFADIRQKIKEACCDVVRTIYDAKDTSGHIYDKVVVVAHSLGSVIAYDTINDLFNEEIASPLVQLDRIRRTRFITFGSPLDKVAFAFRLQKTDLQVREALSAAVQPMIDGYQFRPSSWINIYSTQDPISGALDYYDSCISTPRNSINTKGDKRIDNRCDAAADIPFFAHLQYFHNTKLAEALYEAMDH